MMRNATGCDSQGKPVLLCNNWKKQRIGRQLPLHEPTAQLITTQQKRVRERFPDGPPSTADQRFERRAKR